MESLLDGSDSLRDIEVTPSIWRVIEWRSNKFRVYRNPLIDRRHFESRTKGMEPTGLAGVLGGGQNRGGAMDKQRGGQTHREAGLRGYPVNSLRPASRSSAFKFVLIQLAEPRLPKACRHRIKLKVWSNVVGV